MGTQCSSDEITEKEIPIAGSSSDLQHHAETAETVLLKAMNSLKDAAITERDQEINTTKQSPETLERELLTAKKLIEELRQSNKRQNRRINFLTEKNAELQDQVDELNEELNARLFSDAEGDIQPGTWPIGSQRQEQHSLSQGQESLGGLENRVADLSLTNNDLRRLIKDERRKVLDLRSEVLRKDRMVEFLNLRITSYVVDDSDVERSDGS